MPLAGRLCFAGEHTQSARLVYADGAFCSGIREAKRLLRSPTMQGDVPVACPIGR
jgi:monoamine oxidase